MRDDQWGYGHDFNPPVNDEKPRMTGKANVWQVGKVMYDLYSLSDQERYDDLKAKSGHEYHVVNRSDTLFDWMTTPFVDDLHRQRSPYSPTLSQLISRCMAANSADRPTADQLYNETLQCLRSSSQHSQSVDPVSVRNTTLYYRGNEINNMAIDEMNCYHHLPLWDYFRLLQPANNDPSEPRLKIYPGQTRDTLVGLDDDEIRLALDYNISLEEHIQAYRWRKHEVKRGRIRRHDDRILFEDIQSDEPPTSDGASSSSFDTDDDDYNDDFDDLSKRDMERRWLNAITDRPQHKTNKQQRPLSELRRQSNGQQRQACEQQNQANELHRNMSYSHAAAGIREGMPPARDMTPMRHIEEMEEAMLFPTRPITDQLSVSVQP